MQASDESGNPDFDTEKAVAEYRCAIDRLESANTPEARDEFRRIAHLMRQEWKAWQGEDSLHEMTFGEAVDD